MTFRVTVCFLRQKVAAMLKMWMDVTRAAATCLQRSEAAVYINNQEPRQGGGALTFSRVTKAS